MSCCSTHCERYWICAHAYETGSTVNWYDYGYGGLGTQDVSYCGPSVHYVMFEPVDEAILEGKIAAYQVALERLREIKHEKERML